MAATLRYADLLAAARRPGLVDNKVASFSPTHTALRLVIPVALRPRLTGRCTIRRMPDLLLILIVILVLAILWRGPKTLPKIGEALGRGVKEAKTEAAGRAGGDPGPRVGRFDGRRRRQDEPYGSARDPGRAPTP